MRNLTVAISVVLIAVLVFSCGKKGPEEVVKKYYTHLCKKEFDKIQDYVLEEHRSFYGLLSQVVSDEEKTEGAKSKVEITNISCKIFDNTEAICSCMIKIDGQDPKIQETKLKKVGKSWFIDQGKENNEISPDEEDYEDDFGEDYEDEELVEEVEPAEEVI